MVLFFFVGVGLNYYYINEAYREQAVNGVPRCHYFDVFMFVMTLVSIWSCVEYFDKKVSENCKCLGKCFKLFLFS